MPYKPSETCDLCLHSITRRQFCQAPRTKTLRPTHFLTYRNINNAYGSRRENLTSRRDYCIIDSNLDETLCTTITISTMHH